jgi:hypothetical protein
VHPGNPGEQQPGQATPGRSQPDGWVLRVRVFWSYSERKQISVFEPGSPHSPVTQAIGQEHEMKTRRPTKIYLLIMVLIMSLGLPARMIQDRLPSWYVQYFGDYLWAMLLFFGFALIFQKLSTFKVAIATLLFTYCIEVSELFHPQWLDYLRSIKIFALVLGYTFLWSDLVAYTLGVSTGALIEYFLLRRISLHQSKHLRKDQKKV